MSFSIRRRDRLQQRLADAGVVAALALGACAGVPAAASASHQQIAIIQDQAGVQSDPGGTMAQFRALGATTVRVFMPWATIAPNPLKTKAPKKEEPSLRRRRDEGMITFEATAEPPAADGAACDNDPTIGPSCLTGAKCVVPTGSGGTAGTCTTPNASSCS